MNRLTYSLSTAPSFRSDATSVCHNFRKFVKPDKRCVWLDSNSLQQFHESFNRFRLNLFGHAPPFVSRRCRYGIFDDPPNYGLSTLYNQVTNFTPLVTPLRQFLRNSTPYILKNIERDSCETPSLQSYITSTYDGEYSFPHHATSTHLSSILNELNESQLLTMRSLYLPTSPPPGSPKLNGSDNVNSTEPPPTSFGVICPQIYRAPSECPSIYLTIPALVQLSWGKITLPPFIEQTRHEHSRSSFHRKNLSLMGKELRFNPMTLVVPAERLRNASNSQGRHILPIPWEYDFVRRNLDANRPQEHRETSYPYIETRRTVGFPKRASTSQFIFNQIKSSFDFAFNLLHRSLSPNPELITLTPTQLPVQQGEPELSSFLVKYQGCNLTTCSSTLSSGLEIKTRLDVFIGIKLRSLFSNLFKQLFLTIAWLKLRNFCPPRDPKLPASQITNSQSNLRCHHSYWRSFSSNLINICVSDLRPEYQSLDSLTELQSHISTIFRTSYGESLHYQISFFNQVAESFLKSDKRHDVAV